MCASQSIDANIVEGRGQKTDAEFCRYLRIAVNSTNELESHAIMGHDLGAIKKQEFASFVEQLVEVRKMLHGLINKLGG